MGDRHTEDCVVKERERAMVACGSCSHAEGQAIRGYIVGSSEIAMLLKAP